MHFFSAVSFTVIQTGDVNVRNKMRSRRAGFLTEARAVVSITVGPVVNGFSFYLSWCPVDTALGLHQAGPSVAHPSPSLPVLFSLLLTTFLPQTHLLRN